MRLPDVAVDDVREQFRQDGGVFEVSFGVIRVDGTFCVTIPALLFFSQLVIIQLHCCQ